MTNIDEKGQLYFVFEELDFDGALSDLMEDVRTHRAVMEKYAPKFPAIANFMQSRISDYMECAIYLRRLKRGQNYVKNS